MCAPEIGFSPLFTTPLTAAATGGVGAGLGEELVVLELEQPLRMTNATTKTGTKCMTRALLDGISGSGVASLRIIAPNYALAEKAAWSQPGSTTSF